LESVRTVKAFGRQNFEQEELATVSRSSVEAALKARRVKSLLGPIVSVTVSVCVAFVLWRGAFLALAGIMTAGALTVFLSYLSKFFKHVQDLAKMTNTIAQASVGLERIQAILETDAIIPERLAARDPHPTRGEIIFEHVEFGYEKDNPVLKDVTFAIQPGQTVGIVGPTGCGKSTVASLIPRFYDPSGGNVKIDGFDLRDYKLHPLRDQIGFVLQDTVLFSGTIGDNIAYGRPGATQEEIEDAAKLANAHEFIAKMPKGYG